MTPSTLSKVIITVALGVTLVACGQQRKIDSIALSNQGVKAYNVGDIEKAFDYFTQAIDIYPDNQVAYYHLGLIYLYDEKDTDKATPHFQKALELDPEDADVMYQLGILMDELGNEQDAEKYFTQAVAASPEYAAAYYRLGVYAEKRSEFALADGFFRKAIDVDSSYAPAFSALGQLYLKFDEVNKSKAILKEGIKLNSSDVESRLVLAEILIHEGDLEEAGILMTDAINIDPERADLYFNMGYIMALKEQYKAASSFMDKYISLAKTKEQKAMAKLATSIIKSLKKDMEMGGGTTKKLLNLR